LLATDAAGEGLNLQATCRTVVNIELPWNPMRLEQRIGRVDRIGQRHTVHAFHFIAASGEERMLRRLQERLRRAQADIDTSDPLASGEAREFSVSEPTDLEVVAAEECAWLAQCRRLAGNTQSAPRDHEVLTTRSRRPTVR